MEGKPNQPETGDALARSRQRKKYRIKIIALGMALLLSGILMGAGGMFFWGRKLVLQNIRRGADPARITAHLEKTLDLNAEQKLKVEEILNTHMPKLREIRRSKYVLIRQEIKAMNEEIAAILDERQVKIWEEKMDRIMPFRRYKRHGHHRAKPPPGERPPGPPR